MTEDDWKVAWSFFERGWTFREIERHFNVGHTTISKGFARRGWYDRKALRVLPQPEVVNRQPEPTPSPGKRTLNRGWTPTLEFMAGWLADKGHRPEHIAEVVCLPVDKVRAYLSGTSQKAA